MKLKIKKLVDTAIVPTFAHDSDAGMDLCTIEETVIHPGERALLRTGLALAIPVGHVGLIWDKSGVAAKRGMKTLAGVVDAGYRGEVLVALLNTGSESQSFNKGDKVAQMLIQEIHQPQIEVVEDLDETSRGDGGFGSTGA